MNRQNVHKVVIIALLMTAFAIPFYLQRQQINKINQNAYMISAALSNRTGSAQTIQSNDNGQTNSAMDVLGGTFVVHK